MNAQSKQAVPVGVVVVTPTDYGDRLITAAECIMGPQNHCRAVSVDVAQEVGLTLDTLKAAVQETDQGAGVLILTDMFGGTPSNLSISVMNTGKVEVIAGMNLPMLIKLAGIRAD